MRTALLRGTAAVLLTAAAAGCSSATATTSSAPPGSRISVSGAYIPLPAGGSTEMAAGYLVLRNTGGQADTLTGVSSPQAASVTMHQSTATTMQPLDAVPVPAHGTVTFARGGRHLMLMGLAETPKVGHQVQLRLEFKDAGTVTVSATIEPLTYQPPGS
ncbi:copper chaperone PCu(A)C [Streptacidiphilus monticola]|uniref:Copper chaperone PCu(A)C n=1 Tax=Streptacidiphilus monticola TaxID=2161674 RepID=A0ABW1GA08_9ACTN